MAEVASLVLKVTSDGATLTADQLRQLSRAAKESEAGFSGVAKQIIGFTTAAQVAVQAGQAVLRFMKDATVESVKLAAGFEKARITWGVLVGDMGKGNAIFEDLRRFAAETPLSFEGIEQAAQTLKGFGVETEQLIPTLSRLGDLSRGDNSALGRLALVFGQVQAQGKAMTQDLYQFVNSGVPIFQLLADSMGVSAGQIKELTADGKIGFEQIEAAIVKATSAGGQFFGLMDKTAESASGEWSTAVDNVKESMANFGQTILDIVLPALKAFNDEMDRRREMENYFEVIKDIPGTTDIQSINDAISTAQKERERYKQSLLNIGRLPLNVQAQSEAEAQKAIAQIDSRIERLEAQAAKLEQAAIRRGAAIQALETGAIPVPTAPGISQTPIDRVNISTQIPFERTGLYDIVDPLETANAELEITRALISDTTVSVSQLGYSFARTFDEIDESAKKTQESLDKLFYESINQIGEFMGGAILDSAVTGLESIGASLVDASTGAQSFADSMQDIGNSILQSMPEMLIMAGLNAISSGRFEIGLALLAAGGFTAIGAGAYQAAGYSGSGSSGGSFVPNAAGGVYNSPSLHSYVNGIYDKPQMFAFARGGVFAEAGPEAIMPLKRDAQGKLGVSASGNSVSVVVNNLAPGTVADAEERQGPNGREVVVTVKAVVKDMVARGELDPLLRRARMNIQGSR